MTAPTKEQLTHLVSPTIRMYIDAAIKEAIADAAKKFDLQVNSLSSLDEKMSTKMAELEQFERQVRSHLGIYVPE